MAGHGRAAAGRGATPAARRTRRGGGTGVSAGRTVGPAGGGDHVRGPGGRTLQGAWAAADEPRGGVLVVHENRGLTDHIRSVAGRLAASGYSALAVDLLSEEGGTGSFGGRGRRSPRR